MFLTGVTNEHEFRVFAMKRSGHHAVMSWIMAHFGGAVYFLNNCSFVDRGMFSSTRVGRFDPAGGDNDPPQFSGRVSVFQQAGAIVNWVEHLPKDALVDRPRDRLQALAEGELETLRQTPFPAERDAYLFNLEDFNIDHLAAVPFDAAARGESRRIHHVIVLRDPCNWLASRYRGGFPIDEEVLAAWKSQCREALGETDNLNGALVVNYDRWFGDAAYRRELASQFGYQGVDPGIGKTADFGGGSSFSGFEYRESAERMDVLHRWQLLQDDAGYQRLFEGQTELLELGAKFFPDSPVPEFLA